MITIDLESTVPLEEQVRQEIRRALAFREIQAGDELPSVRQLAADLGIHWNTVARAYRRLRDEGLLVVGRGRGVYVRELAVRHAEDDPECLRRVEQKLREAVTEARLGGMPFHQFERLVQEYARPWAGAPADGSESSS